MKIHCTTVRFQIDPLKSGECFEIICYLYVTLLKIKKRKLHGDNLSSVQLILFNLFYQIHL